MSLRKIAYLTGEYPRASDTFIQREVAALRDLGHEVQTCSIRRTGVEHLVGPEQRSEQSQTFHVLEAVKSTLFLRALGQNLRQPARFLSALKLAWSTAPKGIKGRLYQMIYLAEAMVLATKLQDAGVTHLHNHIAKASCTVAMLASHLSGIPYSFTIHGPDIFFEPHHWRIDVKAARRTPGVLAVLTGDSLIILAFEVLARATVDHPGRGAQLLLALSRRTGMPNGICAGQGWESEAEIDLGAYHRSKTAALFIAATEMGAIASGHPSEEWLDLGALIGEAFQVADDLRDALLDEASLGKPVGQDDLHGRPNAVCEMGIGGAVDHLSKILAAAIASIPSCPGEAMLAQMVSHQADKIMPAVPARYRG